MYPRRLLILLAVASFLLGLLLLAPARLLLSALPLEAAGVEAVAANGTVFNGGAVLQAGVDRWRLRWQLEAGWLLLLQARIGVQADSGEARADAVLVLAPWGRSLQVERLALPASLLNQWLRRQRVTVDQPLAGAGLLLHLRGGQVVDAGGRLAWGPGELKLATREAPLALPAMRGSLAAVDGRLELLVDGEAAPGEPLVTGAWDPAGGEVRVAVLQRAATLVGAVGEAPRSPDTVVFEWRQAPGQAGP